MEYFTNNQLPINTLRTENPNRNNPKELPQAIPHKPLTAAITH
jgi:hypothetical protein